MVAAPTSGYPRTGPGLGRFLAAGYDRRSPVALLVLSSTAAGVGYHWRDLLDQNGNMDWLLAGIWTVMAALICWRVRARRDLSLLVVGACGGAVIEWWGTNTGLWWYFTGERPPLWILPAWPIAALSVDRLARILGYCLDRLEQRRGKRDLEPWWPRAYWVLVPGFVLWMTQFIWPYRQVLATQVVGVLMVVVIVNRPEPRRDVGLFVAGALLGIFLEYWGTSRECWTYYTRQVPPPVAVAAHGFAALAFSRAQRAIDRVTGWSTARAPGLGAGGGATSSP